MIKFRNLLSTALMAATVLVACKSDSKKETAIELKPAPEFNVDSAYAYVAKQVSFGPRVPNTPEHVACGDWMVTKLKSFGAEVIEQTGEVVAFDSTVLPLRNIIASFQPENKNRLLLCAHWDTRPFADQDSINQDEPALGANDGGSGVGVLMEVARVLNAQKPNVGVDLVFFDVEDYGRAEHWPPSDEPHTYCLGSQYWCNNFHVDGYSARYGILLDMIGGEKATYCQEGISMQYAGSQMEYVWKLAKQLGYGDRFLPKKTRPITDDHTYINQMSGIPTMDIIEYDPLTVTNYDQSWHTHSDSLAVISKASLNAVGHTITQVIYNE